MTSFTEILRGGSKVAVPRDKTNAMQRPPEITMEKARPMFSIRRLAEFFDCWTEDGKPATDTILEWWHSGRIPPPDMRVSRKAVYWRPETIEAFVSAGGAQ